MDSSPIWTSNANLSNLEKLLHANKDQIDAMSEFTINMLKNNFPLPPHVVAKYESTNIISGKFQNTRIP